MVRVAVYSPPWPTGGRIVRVPVHGSPFFPLNLQWLVRGALEPGAAAAEECPAAGAARPPDGAADDPAGAETLDQCPLDSKTLPILSSSSAVVRVEVPRAAISQRSVVPCVLTRFHEPMSSRLMSGMSRSARAARANPSSG